jgi:hypothetical protein
MATVYGPPEGFDPPDFDDAFVDGRYNMEKDDRIHKEYFDRLATEARRANTGDLIGEIIGFPIADGQALYMVWKQKPLQLVHLAVHDAWQIPEAHARGLRVTDIRQMVEGARKMDELFGRKTIKYGE